MLYKANQEADSKVLQIRKLLSTVGVNASGNEIKHFLREVSRESSELWDRKRKAMEGFKPTPENIQKIIEMNDGLLERFHKAYDDVYAMKLKVDREMASGELDISGYNISVDFFLGYSYEEGIPTANQDMLMRLSDDTDYMYPILSVDNTEDMPSFEDWSDRALHCGGERDLSWNIEVFDLPGLENHLIYYFMHTLFCDSNTFCPADIVYMKPEDLQWQIVVEYEKFKR